jgi:hypothetical protein
VVAEARHVHGGRAHDEHREREGGQVGREGSSVAPSLTRHRG